jgi:hypothetical protein
MNPRKVYIHELSSVQISYPGFPVQQRIHTAFLSEDLGPGFFPDDAGGHIIESGG